MPAPAPDDRPVPPIAVVMPSLNQAAFIDEAVASVMSQPVPGLQLLVQDGGSTDDTPARLHALAQRHPGLAWVAEPDDGPAQALNRAFARALASGAPVVGWLNSDDAYAPDALPRALAHLAAHADQVAVYGEAEHVDAAGRAIGRYPTRGPDGPLEDWRDGCPVCQPTMLLRRETLQALGPLDESLRTAFDYDLWLRLFRRFPGRVGFVPAVQARSRLHAGAITLRQRERVAMEGLQVVHRHFGAAPGHWLLTHVAEATAACPFDAKPAAVRQRLLELADQASPWLGPGGADVLRQAMQATAAWRLLHDGLALDVSVDGWAGPRLAMRLKQRAAGQAPVGALRLRGRMAWPRPWRWRLRLAVWHGERELAATHVVWRRRFDLRIPVAGLPPEAGLTLELRCDGFFVPADVLAHSHDTRRLSVLIESAELLTLL
jgi:Glycosyl transferase family 2